MYFLSTQNKVIQFNSIQYMFTYFPAEEKIFTRMSLLFTGVTSLAIHINSYVLNNTHLYKRSFSMLLFTLLLLMLASFSLSSISSISRYGP